MFKINTNVYLALYNKLFFQIFKLENRYLYMRPQIVTYNSQYYMTKIKFYQNILVVLHEIKTSIEKILIKLLIIKFKYVLKSVKWKKYTLKTFLKISIYMQNKIINLNLS